MARGDFTVIEALRVHGSFDRVLDTLPKKVRLHLNEEVLDVYRFLESAMKFMAPRCDACGSPIKKDGSCTRKQCCNAD